MSEQPQQPYLIESQAVDENPYKVYIFIKHLLTSFVQIYLIG